MFGGEQDYLKISERHSMAGEDCDIANEGRLEVVWQIVQMVLIVDAVNPPAQGQTSKDDVDETARLWGGYAWEPRLAAPTARS